MSDHQYATRIQLRDGRVATVRALEAPDVEPLTAFFLSLSAQTRSRYGPHPFDRATAEMLCATINNRQTVRFIAVLHDDTASAEIVGYIILSREIWPDDKARYGNRLRLSECACFAPVVADAYQDQGIGTQMARHVLASAGEMGLRQIILMGGVMANNDRARHFYKKLGFRELEAFDTVANGVTVGNYNMMMEL